MQTILVAGAALLLAWTASVKAQTAANPHAGHGAHGPAGGPQQGGRTDQGAAMQKGDPHAGHGMPPSALTGPWAHTAAGSPPPHVENRWEVVPTGDSPLFVAADGLTREQRCGAINASKRMIVDEATRASPPRRWRRMARPPRRPWRRPRPAPASPRRPRSTPWTPPAARST